jgi:PAS domain S-box-containing protein
LQIQEILLLLAAAGAGALLAVMVMGALRAGRSRRDGSRLQDQLQDARDRLHGVIQSAMDAIITVDEQQKIVLFNAAAERIFRCAAADALGSRLERFVPERFRAAHHAHVEGFGATGTTTRHMGGRRVLAGLRADGEEFPIDASISQVTVDARKLYTVILRDITEQLASEEALRRSFNELREMSAAMNDVREAERTRIARELHDELAQWLTALKMDVSWLSGRLPSEADALHERTERMRQLVDTTVAAVRRIASDLRPVMLDDLGLVPSIEHVVHAFSERTNVPVSLDIQEADADLQDPVATAVYRIVQEALTNVARHARATEVGVSVRVEGRTLHVRVADNGVGLPAAPGGRSHGILGIRERAQTLGGDARIFSPPEGGTVVEVSIPLERYRRREAAT